MAPGLESGLLGQWGETLAGEYLRARGYTLAAVNYRCRGGEVDIIARKGRYLAFVEVKLRKDAEHGLAREFVTAAKQRRVRLAAELWLARHPENRLQPRFDVIEIYAPEGVQTKRPKINHIEDAFE